MFVLIVFLSATLIFFLVCFLRARSAELDFVPADLTICAAHSDDCVIMGAEMAQQVLGAGHSVTVIYLTCSAASAETDIAKERAEEARTAWETVGVSAESLHFLNIPESPVGGPPNYGPEEITGATDWLVDHFRKLLPQACVLIPAEGESHIDHRTMRNISLLALQRSDNAQKIALYEVTEYNSYLSMLQDPLAVLNKLARTLPLLGRVVPKRQAAPGFVSGPPGRRIYNPSALTAKIAMLEAFHSQDPALLRYFFGVPSRYRRIKVPADAMKPANTRYFDFLEAKSDTSVLVFFALVVSSVFGFFLMLAQVGPAVAVILGLLLAGALLITLMRRRYASACLFGAGCFGLVVGAI